MEKRIDLTQTVYRLTEAYPELIGIMASLGFTEIGKKAIRLSVGKLVTIPQGAAMRGISLERVVGALQENGFTVAGCNPEHADRAIPRDLSHPALDATRQIKSLLKRVNNGEPIENVRADFVKNFRNVPANAIMRAEQELISEGQSVNELKKLCDVHSALFHEISDEYDFHRELHHDQEAVMAEQAAGSRDRTAGLRAIGGHPLQTFYLENEAINKALDAVVRASDGGDAASALIRVGEISIHYAKKGDLIYPLLKTKYGIYGPSQVMWTIDGEIRSEITGLLKQAAKNGCPDNEWRRRVKAVVRRAREMTFKENRILFPVCTSNFTEEDWQQIYVDSKVYPICLGVKAETWHEGEVLLGKEKQKYTQPLTGATGEPRVVMPGGSLTLRQLTAMLDTLPMEITFVDAENVNRYFNQPFSEKSFKRPLAALGREVFSCHPPKVEPMVRAIIADLREGRRNSVSVWMEKERRIKLVTYHAVRDSHGCYVGIMETVQDMEEARKHFSN